MGSESKCTSCDFAVYIGRDIYAVDSLGRRIDLPVPSSDVHVALELGLLSDFTEACSLLGIDVNIKPNWWWTKERRAKWEKACLIQAEVKRRSGYSTSCVCLKCFAHTGLDLTKDSLICSKCGSSEVVSTSQIGECPKCHQGRLKDTGVRY